MWNPEAEQLMFVGLNPSTADETQDDPTIRRLIGFASAWGFGGIQMLNLFAFRATLPSDMLREVDPVGPENDAHLVAYAARTRLVIAAWGTHGAHNGRDHAVRMLLPSLHYLRLTKHGHPAHPLYLPASLRPVPWARSS